MNILLVLACLAATAGCSDPETEPAPAAEAAEATPADSVTRRQRDSVIGESRLPGARGVRGALDASDAAADRAAALDSAAGGSRP